MEHVLDIQSSEFQQLLATKANALAADDFWNFCCGCEKENLLNILIALYRDNKDNVDLRGRIQLWIETVKKLPDPVKAKEA